jgi:hypothetical protein
VRLGIALLLWLAPVVTAPAAAQQVAAGSVVEEIFVLRSVRLSRRPASDFCAERRTGFPAATSEDEYEFKAVAARPADGRVTEVAGPTMGHLHTCLGATSDPLVFTFYAEGNLSDVPLTGRGDCRTNGREFPEPGITPWRCHLDFTGLPGSFLGGYLTSNTVVSRAVLGAVSDPAGYTQPSIATIRLWRKR